MSSPIGGLWRDALYPPTAKRATNGRQNSTVPTTTRTHLYSLIESAKLVEVESRAYLREATLRAVWNPGTVSLARDLKSLEA